MPDRPTPFDFLRNRQGQYKDGYRAATKACADWLLQVAEEADDCKHGGKANRRARTLRQASASMANEAKAVAFDDDAGCGG